MIIKVNLTCLPYRPKAPINMFQATTHEKRIKLSKNLQRKIKFQHLIWVCMWAVNVESMKFLLQIVKEGTKCTKKASAFLQSLM